MEPARKIALAAGLAYLVTFAASIPQLKLFAAVIADPAGYISNPVGFQNSAVAGDLRFQAATPCPCWRTAIELRPDRAGLPRTESGTSPSATGAVAARRATRSRA
jgi:hypothetical protein